MDQVLLQVGVGGIFAIFIIREVLNFTREVLAKRHSRSETNGNGNRRTLERPIDPGQQGRMVSLLERVIPLLEEIKSAQKDDLEIIRTRFHDIFNGLQQNQLLLEVIKSRMENL